MERALQQPLGDEVLVLLRHGDDDLRVRDGFPSLRSLRDARAGPRHVRWITSGKVLRAPSRWTRTCRSPKNEDAQALRPVIHQTGV